MCRLSHIYQPYVSTLITSFSISAVAPGNFYLRCSAQVHWRYQDLDALNRAEKFVSKAAGLFNNGHKEISFIPL
jgi:hypothetical protein